MAQGWCFLLLTLGVCGLSSSVPRQFHVVKEEKTWADAQQHCREEFTDLATIHNMTEMEEIKSMIQDVGAGGKVWIGLKKGSSPKWQWSLADEGFYGENEAEYRNWGEGQPSGRAGEDCGSIHKGGEKWHDRRCTEKRRFFCYNKTNSAHPYVLISPGENWADAQRYCRENHTDLASVRNLTENKLIKDLITGAGSSYPWIGLFRDAWEWSDGRNSSFRHWAPGEPNFGDDNIEFCVQIKSSGWWNDVGCSETLDNTAYFVCYEALPTVEVVSPQSPFYPGDVITLSCDIPKYTDQYIWLKDNSPVPGETNQTITITLPEDVGQYQCYRRRNGSSVTPYTSTPVNMTFNNLPNATVEVVSPQSPFYSGDNVTLECNVTNYTDWHQYVWLKDNSTLPGNQSKNITITVEAGRYRCFGKREDRPMKSSESASVNITNYDKYVLVNEKKSWKEALEYCRQHHVDLVSVSSEQIQRWVAGWAKGDSTTYVWLGLRYSCNLGFWFWVSGEIICYDNWASDQERDRGCTHKVGAVGKDGGKWVSFKETEKLNFICTKEGQWN